jgi:hypothetical protein
LYAKLGIVAATDAITNGDHYQIPKPQRPESCLGLQLIQDPKSPKSDGTVVLVYAYTVDMSGTLYYKTVYRVFHLEADAEPPQNFVVRYRHPNSSIGQKGGRGGPFIFTFHTSNGSFSSSQHLSIYNISFDHDTNVDSIDIKTAPGTPSDPYAAAWVALPIGPPSNAAHWEQQGIQGRFDGTSTYSLLIGVNWDGSQYGDWVIGHFNDISNHLSTFIEMQ